MGALVVVTALRFNQRDVGLIGSLTGTGVEGNLGDAAQYIRYVEALRGDGPTLPPAPFRYRPLTPLLAAPLPFEAMTSINVVNVVALTVGTLALWILLRQLGATDRLAGFGCLMFVVSYPTFYYGTIGYVDPLAIALMIAVLAALVARKHVVVLALAVLAALARESTVIVVVVAVVWLWTSGLPRREVLRWSAIWSVAFLVTVAALRVGLHGTGTNVWEPSLDLVSSNARRPRTWISAALTLGVPALLVVVHAKHFARLDRQRRTFIAVGIVLSFGLFAYALAAAYADGRFLWPMYAFTIPAAVLLVQLANAPVVDEPAGQPADRRDDVGSQA